MGSSTPTTTVPLPMDALQAIIEFLPLDQVKALKDVNSSFYRLYSHQCARIVEASEREWMAAEVVKHRGSDYAVLSMEQGKRIRAIGGLQQLTPREYMEIFTDVFNWYYRGRVDRREWDRLKEEVEHQLGIYEAAKKFLEDG
jgi:hypothetical protein